MEKLGPHLHGTFKPHQHFAPKHFLGIKHSTSHALWLPRLLFRNKLLPRWGSPLERLMGGFAKDPFWERAVGLRGRPPAQGTKMGSAQSSPAPGQLQVGHQWGSPAPERNPPRVPT